jgi:type I restriction enzyme S subunit
MKTTATYSLSRHRFPARKRPRNHNLEQQAQALYKSWFIDFEPFKNGKFVDSELGLIPEGWTVKNLLELSNVFDSKRKPLSGNERSVMEKIYPYYGATSIMDYVSGYIFDGTYLLMGEDGSVITDEGFPFLQYVTGKFWPNNHAHVLQGKNGFSTEMLHCALLRKVVKASVTGAVQAKISQANMAKILFPCPPSEILEQFDEYIQVIYCQLRNIVEQNKNLTITRDQLLPKLLSGAIITC